MASMLHFVSGKGGTGKSTFSASLAFALAQDSSNLPLLLMDLQGSGSSAKILNVQEVTYAPRPSLWIKDVWGCKILPQESFQEYFTRALYPGSENSAMAQATASIRERVVRGIFSNSVVKSFVEVCPGLEPSAMLGKIHFEASEGTPPESERRWKHVIVDAPSTGHFLSLFSSIEALTRVFSGGIILKQALEIFRFVSNPEVSKIYLLSLPSELPIQESLELRRNLKERRLEVSALVINRVRRPIELQNVEVATLGQDWKSFLQTEEILYQEERELLQKLRSSESELKIVEIPEVFAKDTQVSVERISGFARGVL
jgi:anion-transporting  ArsA/GET3 family ATPase